jgi:glycolate oxidase iron-sulfur subunit
MTDHNQKINYAGKCIRCGLCMSVCPVYQVSLDESDVARGKMALLDWEENHTRIKKSSRFKESISRCLLCGACAQICPNNVPTNICIQDVRQRIAPNIKEKLVMSSINTFSKKTRSGHIFRKSSSILQKCVGKKISENSGLSLRFPLSSMSHRRFVPKIQPAPFTSQYTQEAKSNVKILYFTGCGANFVYHQTALALTDILKKINLTPYVPEKQMCCGLPFYAAGDNHHAATLAKKNIDIIDEISPDILLTTCASCGAQIHQWENLLKNDSEYKGRASKIAHLQKDATSFLLENDQLTKNILWQCDTVAENIWYHHPCHMRWGETQLPVPKELFSPFERVNVIYSDNQCCGNGGKFQISHFDLSMKIFDQRMNTFKQQKIDRVLTSCTGCHLQFQEGLFQNNMNVPVMHPLEWLLHVTIV